MENVAKTTAMVSVDCFPTATPVLDSLRPLPRHHRDRLSASDYFLISSLIMLFFTRMPALRSFMLAVSGQSPAVWTFAFLILPLLVVVAGVAVHEAGHWI